MIKQNKADFKDVYKQQKDALGSGGFGTVYKCRHRQSQQTRAVKVVPKKKIKNMDTFLQEIEILKRLDHPNVLKVYEYFIDDKNVYIVTEICRGGELFDKIVEVEFFPEKDAAILMRQVLRSINYIHSQGIVHRDIKPENFLFDSKELDSDLKIIDFGLSKILQVDKPAQANSNSNRRQKMEALGKMKTKAGTPNYVSPEVLNGSYKIDCDMWSVGCLMYILICGYPPFEGDDDYELCQNILKGRVEFDGEEWDNISKECKNMISGLICKPEKRLTAEEALQHKWFKKTIGKVEKTCTHKIKCDNFAQFKNFGENPGMKQAALTAISVNVSPSDIKDLKDMFLALDVNGDGNLSLEEIKEGLKDRSDVDNIMGMLQAADTDGSGDINYTEFIAATMSANIFMNEQYLRQAFNMFDKDGSGKIDNEEVVALLQGDDMSNIVDKADIMKALEEIDGDGDGEIDFDEFMAMMQKAVSNSSGCN